MHIKELFSQKKYIKVLAIYSKMMKTWKRNLQIPTPTGQKMNGKYKKGSNKNKCK